MLGLSAKNWLFAFGVIVNWGAASVFECFSSEAYHDVMYAVLVDSHPKTRESERPHVVAHNMTLEAAREMEHDLHLTAIERDDPQVLVFVAQYEGRHDALDADGCPECLEVVLECLKGTLEIAEREAAKRGSQILRENADDGGQNDLD